MWSVFWEWKEIMISVQVFQIIRAQEEPPLTAKELRRWIRIIRKDSEWEVIEIRPEDQDAKLQAGRMAENNRKEEIRICTCRSTKIRQIVAPIQYMRCPDCGGKR